jgi:hypothetical protein
MRLFNEIRLLKTRHETTRLLIEDLERRYLLLLRQVQDLQERKS